MEKQHTFSFIESSLCTRDCKPAFWVFREGKFLPVAFIELTPVTVVVRVFKGNSIDMHDEIKESFEKFYGYS